MAERDSAVESGHAQAGQRGIRVVQTGRVKALHYSSAFFALLSVVGNPHQAGFQSMSSAAMQSDAKCVPSLDHRIVTVERALFQPMFS